MHRHLLARLLAIALCLRCGAGADASDVADAGSDAASGLELPTDPGRDPSSDALPDVAAPLPCNGHPELCDRTFDRVAFLTTHNAMANAADGFKLPNQDDDVATQLAKGVRGLMLDTHDEGGVVLLCHSVCPLGQRPLVDTLADLAAFLDANPREVVSIIFESYVSEEATVAAFEQAGLVARAHPQVPGQPWPTLGAMIEADHRLVVLSDNATGAVPWHLPVWQHAVETHWSAKTVADFTCDPNRGDPANPLFILNHFLTNPVASKTLAAEANANPFFLQRALACQAALDHVATFVTVDFATIGDAAAVVEALNGFGQE